MQASRENLKRTPSLPNPRGKGIALALIVLATIGAGSFLLQREVADNLRDALLLSIAWAGIVGAVSLLYARGRDGLTRPLAGGLVIGAVIGAVAFYFASVRDVTVDEQIAVPTNVADAQTAAAGLAAETAAPPAAAPAPPAPTPPAQAPVKAKAAPVQAPAPTPVKPAPAAAPEILALASGTFTGEDGHDGEGTATVVRTNAGKRELTFTDFDVSPGAKVEVWLTTGANETEDRIELGALKGNRGDQQYAVPADANLNRYSTVVLYCTPFTVRIAVAGLKPA